MQLASEKMISSLCEFVWNGFTQVEYKDELDYIVELLECAETRMDNLDSLNALRFLHSAFERVFGCCSDELRDFENVFNKNEELGVSMYQVPAF